MVDHACLTRTQLETAEIPDSQTHCEGDMNVRPGSDVCPEECKEWDDTLDESDSLNLAEASADFKRTVMHTDEPRNVRQKVMGSLSVPFDGKSVFLSSVKDDAASGVSFGELVGNRDEIECAFLTSFCTDIPWVLSHFKVGTRITLVDQADDDKLHMSSTSPLGGTWPNFELAYPRFHGRGSMHSKLMIFKYSTGILRIVISSANLIPFDWEGITQCVWALDVKTDSSPPVGECSVGSDLVEFMRRILAGLSLKTDWVGLVSEWRVRIDSQCPSGVHIVASVPGTFSGDNLHKFGHMRLRRLLETSGLSAVAFQMSSIGQLNGPFVDQFTESVRATSFRLVWPEYSKCMFRGGKGHMFLAEKNASAAQKFLTPLVPVPGREKFLNHSKFMCSLDDNSWVYMGSHNMSMAAWGRLVQNGKALQIASYELGLLLSNTSVFSIRFPFDRTTAMQSMRDKPWMVEAFRRTLGLGTECVSDREYAKNFRNGKEQPFMSFADFLVHEKSVLKIIVFLNQSVGSEYYTNTLREQFAKCAAIYQVTIPAAKHATYSYPHHLLAALPECEAVPAIFLLGQGSSVQDGLRVVKSECSDEAVMSVDPKEFLRQPPGEDDHIVISGKVAAEFVHKQGYSLVCLDVDGTIVESNTSSVLLPRAIEFFEALNPEKVKIALTTNQGAVGLRYWMESGRFGDPSGLPSQAEVEARILAIFEKISQIFTGKLTTFIAFRYQSKGDVSTGKQPRWAPAPLAAKTDPRWEQDWRKPGPGMIRAAMKWAGVSPFANKQVIMIGDMDADEGAARAAGVTFRRAPAFFEHSS